MLEWLGEEFEILMLEGAIGERAVVGKGWKDLRQDNSNIQGWDAPFIKLIVRA